jgi:hypothetical protein
MTLPVDIETVGDIRSAVKGYSGIVDVWLSDVGRHLNSLGSAHFEVSDTFVDGSSVLSIEALLGAVDGMSDDTPVKVWYESRSVRLVAVGPEGENVDFSFNAFPSDAA